MNAFDLYAGTGSTISARKVQLPPFEAPVRIDAPEHYVAGKGLKDAVNVALALGMPLLLTGEPGTGKTQLAGSLAYELGLPPPLIFNAKTTSTATDLFYRYDALRHFHDSHFRAEPLPASGYLTYEALGLAILLSVPPALADVHLPPPLRNTGPTRSIVLIDEIDKAPRDLPNDVLNEIEAMSFTVRETGVTFSASPRMRPILVLTSNSEKNLPDAFLRRCVFYHIPFPDRDRLREIVERRLEPSSSFTSRMLESALTQFEQIRSLPLLKKPATAELLAWLQVLEKMELDVANLKPGQAELLAMSYCVLAKSKDDVAKVRKALVMEV
jgi:MoxR-like ATPase